MVYRSKRRCKTLKGRSIKRNNINNRNHSRKSNKIKQYYVEKKFSDEYMKDKEGEYFDNKDYDLIIRDNCDVYYYDENENKQTLMKFRKNVFPNKLCNIGIDCLKEAAKKHTIIEVLPLV